MWGMFLHDRPRMLTRARDLFAVAILVTLIIGLVNWVELYRYWRRRQQQNSWLESSPISRTVQSRFQYSQHIHGTVHRGTWTDSGSSLTILAADIPEPCLYNINLHSCIYSLTIYRRRRYIWSKTKKRKTVTSKMRLQLPLRCRHRVYVAELDKVSGLWFTRSRRVRKTLSNSWICWVLFIFLL